MKNRRGFLTVLTAVSSLGFGFALVKTQTRKASAAPVQGAKEPSAAAFALAATYRAFDPKLTDADLHTIARNIDDNRAAGTVLNPKINPLKNSDEMVARFAAGESVSG
jgi:hypothetical protein